MKRTAVLLNCQGKEIDQPLCIRIYQEIATQIHREQTNSNLN